MSMILVPFLASLMLPGRTGWTGAVDAITISQYGKPPDECFESKTGAQFDGICDEMIGLLANDAAQQDRANIAGDWKIIFGSDEGFYFIHSIQGDVMTVPESSMDELTATLHPCKNRIACA